MSVCLSVCLSVYVSVRPSIRRPSVRLSVRLSVCLSIFLSICLSIFLATVSIYPFIYSSLHLFFPSSVFSSHSSFFVPQLRGSLMLAPSRPEWVSHRVCTNMQRAQFDRCHQRTSIWITRQPAIFEFTRNGINTWLRPKQQLNTTTTTWKSKQLGTGKGFIIYGLMNWLTKTQLTPPSQKLKWSRACQQSRDF